MKTFMIVEIHRWTSNSQVFISCQSTVIIRPETPAMASTVITRPETPAMAMPFNHTISHQIYLKILHMKFSWNRKQVHQFMPILDFNVLIRFWKHFHQCFLNFRSKFPKIIFRFRRASLIRIVGFTTKQSCSPHK